MTYAIEIESVTKDFPLPVRGRKLRAVDSLSLQVESNVIYGLLGPNGSGKSTTIKLLLGLLKTTEGRCLINGKSVYEPSIRNEVGYLPEAPYYYRFLTGIELVVYFARLQGIKKREALAQAENLLFRVGLEDAKDNRIGTYSKGMLQRVGLAQALVGDPSLLILDEPIAGVDPIGAVDIASLIRELKEQGKTILLCSHLLSQVEALCDRVAILESGRLLAEGPLDKLLVSEEEKTLSIKNLDTEDRERMVKTAISLGGQVSVSRISLETLYLQLIGEKQRKAKLEREDSDQ